MCRQGFHRARISLRRTGRALVAPLSAGVRIVTLVAFVVASVGVPLDVKVAGNELPPHAPRTDAETEHPPGVDRELSVTGVAREHCGPARPAGCGCAAPARQAGRCCCAIPAAASRSCCSTRPVAETESRPPRSQETAPPSRADDREPPAAPVLHCGCGHTDLWTFTGAEPRLLTQPLSLDGTCHPCGLLACGSVRRPHNVATPATPPPERAC